MDIVVYGTKSSTFQYVVQSIKEKLGKSGISFTLKENENIDHFISKKIKSVPAIGVDNQDIISIDSSCSINQSLRKAIVQIMKNENFGNMIQVVHPTDFSATSVNALKYTIGFCKSSNTVIQVVHVYRPHYSEINGMSFTASESMDFINTKLQNYVNENVPIDTNRAADMHLTNLEVLGGFASTAITSFAKDSDAKCIIMGNTGEQGALKKWLGSVSLDTISKATMPILLIPEFYTYKQAEMPILALEAPEDLPYILAKIDWIEDLKATHIKVVHFSKFPISDTSLYDKFIAEANAEGWQLSIEFIKNNEPDQGLISLSVENKSDFLITYHKDSSLIEQLLLKSLNKKIVHAINIPLLVVR